MRTGRWLPEPAQGPVSCRSIPARSSARPATRLIAIDMDWVVLLGPRPIEIIGSLEGEAHIACHKCGELVAVDRDLLLLN